MTLVYFNGAFVEKEAVRVTPDDRGFLFADGVYEVVRSYDGRCFRLEAHLARLAGGLEALRIGGIDVDGLGDVVRQLLTRNNLQGGSAMVYLQITRGAAPRAHAFPDPPPPPTVYAEARVLVPRGDPARGVSVISVPDTRWARCDIKSISLLPNVLANQRAREAGATEAILVRDGIALEGTASSFFAVVRGEVRTAPRSNYILHGITRQVVLALCTQHDLPARELPLRDDELSAADELFLAGTTVEVMPIVRLDGAPVGDGRPGPVTRRLQQLFRAETRATS